MAALKEFKLVILILVSWMILFANISSIPLLDPDETVYAETPKEMLAMEEMISPRIYGDYWYDKPPVYYWLVAGAYKVFGVNEFAARFPSALLAVVCVASMYFLARQMIGSRAAFLSGLVLATSIEFFYLGKAAVTDITLMLFLMLSLLSFFNKQYHYFYLFAGLATLTKGPIGLFFPVVIVFCYLLFTRSLEELASMKIFSGLLIFSIIALPWYIIMYQIHGAVFVDTFLGFHNVTRFTSPEHPSGVLWYYYIPVLLIGFFPWIAVLGQAVYQIIFKACDRFAAMLFCMIWAGVVFLFFTISQTKLVSYILPMYPALALMVGWYIDKIFDKNHQTPYYWSWAGILAGLSVIFSIGAYFGIKEMPELESGVYMLIGVLLVTAISNAIFIWRKNIAMAFSLQVVGMVVLALIVSYVLFPAVAPQFSTQRTAEVFSSIYDGKSPVFVAKFLRPGFAFYTGVYGEELYFSKDKISDIDNMIVGHPKAYIVVRDIDYKRISETTRAKFNIAKEVDNKLILMTK